MGRLERRREAERIKEAKAIKQPEPVQQVEKKTKEPEKQVQRNSIDKELKKELQKQKNIFNQLEEKIARLNKQKTQLEADLASPDVYNDRNRFVEQKQLIKTPAAICRKHLPNTKLPLKN